MFYVTVFSFIVSHFKHTANIFFVAIFFVLRKRARGMLSEMRSYFYAFFIRNKWMFTTWFISQTVIFSSKRERIFAHQPTKQPYLNENTFWSALIFFFKYHMSGKNLLDSCLRDAICEYRMWESQRYNLFSLHKEIVFYKIIIEITSNRIVSTQFNMHIAHCTLNTIYLLINQFQFNKLTRAIAYFPQFHSSIY